MRIAKVIVLCIVSVSFSSGCQKNQPPEPDPHIVPMLPKNELVGTWKYEFSLGGIFSPDTFSMDTTESEFFWHFRNDDTVVYVSDFHKPVDTIIITKRHYLIDSVLDVPSNVYAKFLILGKDTHRYRLDPQYLSYDDTGIDYSTHYYRRISIP